MIDLKFAFRSMIDHSVFDRSDQSFSRIVWPLLITRAMVGYCIWLWQPSGCRNLWCAGMIILCMHPANERQCYIVTSFIGGHMYKNIFWSHEFYIWILGMQEYHSKQKIGSKNQQNSNRVTLVVLKPEYSRQTRSKQCTPDISWLCILRHWIYHGIQTHHDCPSQMYENLLIYRVKRLAIASVLTPLINKFECICEAHVWWVCITKWSSSKYRKNILICRIFHFCGWQIILWWHSMEPFDCAWFGCCPSGRIPSDVYGIPTCNSNDVTRSAVGLTQAASRWKQMRTHAPKRRECAF